MKHEEIMKKLLKKHKIKSGVIIHCTYSCSERVDYSIISEGLGHGSSSSIRTTTYDELKKIK